MCQHFLPVTLSKSSHRARSCCTCGRRQDQEVHMHMHLDRMYQFRPIVVETCGTIGPESRDFLRELGKCLRMVTGEPQSYAFLVQRIFIAIQIATSAISSIPVNATTSISFEPCFVLLLCMFIRVCRCP